MTASDICSSQQAYRPPAPVPEIMLSLAKGELLSSSPGMTGFIVYAASGHVMVHMMYPYRRRNVGPQPTPEETMAAYRGYTSYFGPYTVNESEKYVVHHLVGSINSGNFSGAYCPSPWTSATISKPLSMA